MTTTIAPSAALEAAIEELLAEGLGDGERLAEIGRLGARLVLQRAVEEEVTALPGPSAVRADSGGPRVAEREPAAAGEDRRGRAGDPSAADPSHSEKFVSSVIANGRTALRTRLLEALIIGGWARGLSDRDIENLVSEAGLGQSSKSTVAQITTELGLVPGPGARWPGRARPWAGLRCLLASLWPIVSIGTWRYDPIVTFAGKGAESSMDPVTAAIVAGAAAGVTSTASQAVRDAYEALKALLRERFPRVDVGPLEEVPDSAAKQTSLSEDLARFGADRDIEVVRLASALVGAIARDAPQAAARVGVDLERVKAEFLSIQRVEGGVRARDVEAARGITIADVRSSGRSGRRRAAPNDKNTAPPSGPLIDMDRVQAGRDVHISVENELERRGGVNERFTRAAKQLGQSGQANFGVRIAAVRALEQIAQDSAELQWPVMEVLAAHLREHARVVFREVEEEGDMVAAPVYSANKLPADHQAMATVIGGRRTDHDPTHHLDLQKTHLAWVSWSKANLERVNLAEANLERADLTGANLERANLSWAHMDGAELGEANLERADLTRANLEAAGLDGAHLEGARLWGAHLELADLNGAHLQGADLAGAHLGAANLRGANLEGVKLERADLTEADLDGANLRGANLLGATLIDVDLTQVNLTKAQAKRARMMTDEVTIRIDEDQPGGRWAEEVTDLYRWLRAAGVGDISHKLPEINVGVASSAAAEALAQALATWLVVERRRWPWSRPPKPRLVTLKVRGHQIQATGASHDAGMLLGTFRRALEPG